MVTIETYLNYKGKRPISIYLTIGLRARVFYEQIVTEAQLVENERE